MMRYLVYKATPGLANRLRAFAGYLALARAMGIGLRVQWLCNHSCEAHFTALFEREALGDVTFIAEDDSSFVSDPDCQAVHDYAYPFMLIYQRFGASLLQEDEFERSAISILQGLRPLPALREQIDAQAGKLEVTRAIGVHIRMTDNLNNYRQWVEGGFDPARASRLDGFVSLIAKARDRGEIVFLATDNDAIQRDLVQQFNNVRVVSKGFQMGLFAAHHEYKDYDGRPRRFERLSRRLRGGLARLGLVATSPVVARTLGAPRTTSIQDALVEMYLLSRCRRIVGTYWSSFGQIAAQMGGAPLSTMCGNEEAV
jgi:hypothetical protein